MKVQSIQINLVFPPPFRAPVADSTLGPFTEFPVGLLAIVCDGITGYGLMPVSQSALDLGQEIFFPMLWESDIDHPESVEQFWELARKRIRNLGPGLTHFVLNGIDTALWDVISKKAGKPLFRMLGSERTRVPCYVMSGWINYDLSTLIKTLEESVARGFQTVKMKVGIQSGGGIEEDLHRVKAVRRALGPKIGIAVDANQCWTVQEALNFARLAADEQIAWLEEPLFMHNYQGYSQLAVESPIPIAAGESLTDEFEFRTLLSLHGVALVQPAPCVTGGITGYRRAAKVAQEFGIPVVSGGFSHLTCSLVAATSTGKFTEYAIPFNDSISPLWQQPPQIRNGEFHLVEAAGHGLIPDAGFVRKFSRSSIKVPPAISASLHAF